MGKKITKKPEELQFAQEDQDDAVDLAAQLLEEMGISETSQTGQDIAKDVVQSELSPSVPDPQPKPRRNRRKEKIESRNKALSELVAEAEIEAGNMPNHRAHELEDMAAKIEAAGLQVYDIEANGHCLFASIADQLAQRKDLVADVQSLRSKTAAYIRKNADEFAPYLFNEDTGDLIDVEKYCSDLENTAMWGGEVEIKALSQVFKTPIKVFFAAQPTMTISDEFTDEPLFIAYYTKIYGLGAHYNSLRENDGVPDAFIDT